MTERNTTDDRPLTDISLTDDVGVLTGSGGSSDGRDHRSDGDDESRRSGYESDGRDETGDPLGGLFSGSFFERDRDYTRPYDHDRDRGRRGDPVDDLFSGLIGGSSGEDGSPEGRSRGDSGGDDTDDSPDDETTPTKADVAAAITRDVREGDVISVGQYETPLEVVAVHGETGDVYLRFVRRETATPKKLIPTDEGHYRLIAGSDDKGLVTDAMLLSGAPDESEGDESDSSGKLRAILSGGKEKTARDRAGSDSERGGSSENASGVSDALAPIVADRMPEFVPHLIGVGIMLSLYGSYSLIVSKIVEFGLFGYVLPTVGNFAAAALLIIGIISYRVGTAARSMKVIE